MNKLQQLFAQKQNNLLSIYFTAGFPKIDSTVNIIKALATNGADIIEIGMPFSDPVADGAVIQESNIKALRNGMSIKHLFDQLQSLNNTIKIPMVLMGYFNPVFHFGVEEFCRKCAETGIDGVILPDLPPEIYIDEYKSIFEKYNISAVFLITPQTSDERLKYIDSISDSFIYAVSSYATTGNNKEFSELQIQYFEQLSKKSLKHQHLIGFGIYDKKSFETAAKYASGAIIGSAFIKYLNQFENPSAEDIAEFVKNIKNNSANNTL